MTTTDTKPRGGAMNTFNNVLVTVGKAVGGVVGALYQAGRDSIDTVIRNILPFMAFVALLIGIINETGIGDALAHAIEPLASSLLGLMVISIFCAIPDPLPGARPGRRHRAGGRASCSVPGSAPATSRRSTRCRRCSPSTPRSAATSSPSAWPWARPRRRQSRWACPAVLVSRLFTGPGVGGDRLLRQLRALHQHDQLATNRRGVHR